MMKQIWRHPWIIAVSNLLLVLALYTLSRLVFVWVNPGLYPTISGAHLWEMCVGGVRFDLTAVLYLNTLYLALMLLPLPRHWRTNMGYQKTAKWAYWIPNILGLAANTVDMVYVRFTDKRTTWAFFSEFKHDTNLGQIFFTGMGQYWYITLYFLVITGLLVWTTRCCKPDRRKSRWFYYVRECVVLLVSVYFIVIGIRGGFGAWTRPITLSNALQYTNTPKETAIVLNTPFSLMRSTEGKNYTNPKYFTEEELEQIMSPVHHDSLSTSNRLGQINVVILILESFSKEYIGFYNHHLKGGTYEGYTPFLDSLLSVSQTYRYSYASGRKSIDAMPSVLSSIPMLIAPYVVTSYSTNAVSSIADCLRKEGYTTAFFHGAPNGSMGFQAYARSAGFKFYYGKNEYDGPEAFDGTWAIWDEEFLQYYGRTMSTMQEPFCTAVFTASSHHPFRVPKRYEGVFAEGDLPIHACIGYSDHALRLFFDYAKKQSWYERTLFVLTADHTNQLSQPEYQTDRGLYEVPIAFYYPKTKGEIDSTSVVSQTDIMPSVLGFLGYNKPYFAFGEDVLSKKKTHNYAICYNTNVYQIISDSILIQFDGNQVTKGEEDEEILTYLKAYIQQYINRMIENRLTIK